jgi:hypothetical protein
MRVFTVNAFIPRPPAYLLRAFAEYTHIEKLHGHRNVKVKPLYEKGDVSICLWSMKVLGFTRTFRQLQTVYPEELKMVNETIDGFGKGTVETVTLKEAHGGSEIAETVHLKLPFYFFWMERPVESFTRKLIAGYYDDHIKYEASK